MIERLIIILALAFAASPLQAGGIFERAEHEKREFAAGVEHRQREFRGNAKSAVWLPTEDKRRAAARAGAYDDDDEFEEVIEENYEDQSDTYHEADYRDDLCNGKRMEVSLANGSRADCLSSTDAIEVGFSEKWAKAPGQALSDAGSTGLTPAIFLVCRDAPNSCLRHFSTPVHTLRSYRRSSGHPLAPPRLLHRRSTNFR